MIIHSSNVFVVTVVPVFANVFLIGRGLQPCFLAAPASPVAYDGPYTIAAFCKPVCLNLLNDAKQLFFLTLFKAK